MGTEKDSLETKKRLIDSAGKLFAEKGFKGATVREIIKDAKSHLGAMNYHFGTKENLYKETLVEACDTYAISENDKKNLLSMEPYEAIYLFVSESLKEFKRGDSSAWQTKILMREGFEPTQFFNEIVDRYFTPKAKLTEDILEKIADNPDDKATIQFASTSLNNLIETFGGYSHCINPTSKELSASAENIEWLTEKIINITTRIIKG